MNPEQALDRDVGVNGKGKKRKKEIKTKQVVVNALDFIDIMRKDADFKFPIVMVYYDRHGGMARYINNEQEFDKFCKWGILAQSGIVRASKPRGTFYIEFSLGGRVIMNKEILPEVKALDILLIEEVEQIYDSLVMGKL